MLGKLISATEALIYTFLAFIVPFYWTCKALLRQFTHSDALTVSAPMSIGVKTTADESIVPQEAEEDGEVPMSSIPAFAPSESKPLMTTLSKPFTASSTTAIAGNFNTSLVNWLYYWALLAAFHVLTGLYELIVVPVLGSSSLYRLGKLGVLVWMNHDEMGAPARLAWNSLIGPMVSAYERDFDALISRCQVAMRTAAVNVYSSGRSFVQSKFIPVDAESESLKVD